MSNSSGVNIVCKFHESSPYTSCVVIVYQRDSLFRLNGLINIQSYTFTRVRDTAVGFIEGVNEEDNQFGVVGGIRDDPQLTSGILMV